MTTSPMQYLDKAMNALHDMGLVPSDGAGDEAPIIVLLNLISDLDEERVAAIARTLNQASLFNEVVREQEKAQHVIFKQLREALSDWPRKDLQIETARHYDPYWQGLHVTAHKVFAEMLRDVKDDEVKIDLHPDEDQQPEQRYHCKVHADPAFVATEHREKGEHPSGDDHAH